MKVKLVAIKLKGRAPIDRTKFSTHSRTNCSSYSVCASTCLNPQGTVNV
jgi:hypothetical protein